MAGSMKNHEHGNCRKLLGSISEYVDGELNEELCGMLEQHLLDCENCRIVVDTLKKTVYLYQTTAEEENIPSDMRQRLYKSLNLEKYLE